MLAFVSYLILLILLYRYLYVNNDILLTKIKKYCKVMLIF